MISLNRKVARIVRSLALAAALPSVALAADPVTIGLIDPIKTLVGQQNVEGAELAAEMINEQGGILDGRKIELIKYDTNFQPQDGVAAAQRLLTQDGVKVIVGEISSTVALAVIPVVESEDALFVASVPKHPDVTMSGYDKVFRMNSSATQDQKFFDRYLDEVIQPEKVAVIVENTDFGQLVISHMKDVYGDKVAYSDTFGMQQSDFSSLATNAKSSGADIVCISGSNMEQYGNLLRTLSELNYEGRRCFLPGILNSQGVEIAGDSAENAFGADFYVPAIENEANEAFVAAFEKKYGRKPEKIEALGFEAVWIAAKAMDQAGTADDTAKIADVIRKGSWATPRGDVTFDENGQASAGDLLPLVVKSGEIVVAN